MSHSKSAVLPPAATQSTIDVVVSHLYSYPIKSCAPVPVDLLEFDQDGLVMGDRAWAVVDDRCRVVWQGSHPKLALVIPGFHDQVLVLRNRDGDEAEAVRGATAGSLQVQIWNHITKQEDTFWCTDGGDKAASLLQKTVGSPLRLVRLSPEALACTRANPVHIVSTASFEEFSGARGSADGQLAHHTRFRPNIVTAGIGMPMVPFIEEHFTRLDWRLGTTTAALVVSGLCVRCVVPNVDPATGQVDPLVLDTTSKLSAQRHPGHPTYFGIYARAEGGGALVRGTVLTAALAF